MASCSPAQRGNCRRPPSSHKKHPLLPTVLWRHFTSAFSLRFSRFGGAFNQALHPSNSENGLISLARELRTYFARLRCISPTHSRCVPDHDILPITSFSISDDLSILTSHTTKCEPTPVRAVFVNSLEEAPLTHSPSSNGTISMPPNPAHDMFPNPLLGGPVARGQGYLRQNAGNLYSQTTQSTKPGDPLELWENFSQLLILETTNDP